MKTLDVIKTCPMCFKPTTINVPMDSYQRWKEGEGKIQDMLPELNSDQREILLSGICPKCWETAFDIDE